MALRPGRLAKVLPRYHTIPWLLILGLAIVAAVVVLRVSAGAIQTPGGAPAIARADDTARVFIPVAGIARSRRAPASPTPTLPAAFTAQATVAPTRTLQAKVEIVWPHENAPVREAELANITVFLLDENGKDPVPCDANYTVRLWRGRNARPARPIAVGQRRMFTARGHTFPAWDFNDVDVSAAQDPANRLIFYATVDGVITLHNVWVHAADARTIFPQAEQPLAISSQRPAAIAARIEILWPHDNLAPERARLANISAYLFDEATGQALAPDPATWTPIVRLHRSLNNDADSGRTGSPEGRPREVTGANGVRFVAWDFNDVDVRAGLDSLNKIHFWIQVDDVPTLTNVWTHGAAAPTIFPQTDLPDACQ